MRPPENIQRNSSVNQLLMEDDDEPMPDMTLSNEPSSILNSISMNELQQDEIV